MKLSDCLKYKKCLQIHKLYSEKHGNMYKKLAGTPAFSKLEI